MPSSVNSAIVVGSHLPGVVFTHMANALRFTSMVFATVGSWSSLCCKTPSDSNNQIILSLFHSHLYRLPHHSTAMK